jgi:hypothetical protein
VTNFIIFCNKSLGKTLIFFSSVNWTNFAISLEKNCQFLYITKLKKKKQMVVIHNFNKSIATEVLVTTFEGFYWGIMKWVNFTPWVPSINH